MLGGLGAEEVTPLEDTMVEHTSIIGQQVETLQDLITNLKTNRAISIRQAVKGVVSFALEKLKTHDWSLSLQPVEADFECHEAKAARPIEEVQPVGKKVVEEMQIGSPP